MLICSIESKIISHSDISNNELHKSSGYRALKLTFGAFHLTTRRWGMVTVELAGTQAETVELTADEGNTLDVQIAPSVLQLEPGIKASIPLRARGHKPLDRPPGRNTCVLCNTGLLLPLCANARPRRRLRADG